MNNDLFEALERCMLVLMEADFTADEIADGVAMYADVWRAKYDGPAAAGRINRVADYLRNLQPEPLRR
jgi:hypothetical protein